MSDLVLLLIAVNLVAAVAALVVLALRLPVRRLFGPAVAYGLWSIVPLAALAVLWPARVVLAHVAAHIRRHDSRVNAAMALARAVNWFNPLLDLAGHYLRIDQELACDAAVVAAHPAARRAYAEAMLKTQLASRPLPMGCYWPAEAAHPLAERIALLSRRTPGRGRRIAVAGVVTVLGLAAAGSAWAIKPARVQVEAPPIAAANAPPPKPERAGRIVNKPRPAAAKPPAPPHAAPKPERLDAENAPARPEKMLPPAAQAEPAPSPVPAPAVAAAPKPWRIITNARLSSVEAGKAVRVVAATLDPEGRQLTATSPPSARSRSTGWAHTARTAAARACSPASSSAATASG